MYNIKYIEAKQIKLIQKPQQVTYKSPQIDEKVSKLQQLSETPIIEKNIKWDHQIQYELQNNKEEDQRQIYQNQKSQFHKEHSNYFNKQKQYLQKIQSKTEKNVQQQEAKSIQKQLYEENNYNLDFQRKMELCQDDLINFKINIFKQLRYQQNNDIENLEDIITDQKLNKLQAFVRNQDNYIKMNSKKIQHDCNIDKQQQADNKQRIKQMSQALIINKTALKDLQQILSILKFKQISAPNIVVQQYKEIKDDNFKYLLDQQQIKQSLKSYFLATAKNETFKQQLQQDVLILEKELLDEKFHQLIDYLRLLLFQVFIVTTYKYLKQNQQYIDDIITNTQNNTQKQLIFDQFSINQFNLILQKQIKENFGFNSKLVQLANMNDVKILTDIEKLANLNVNQFCFIHKINNSYITIDQHHISIAQQYQIDYYEELQQKLKEEEELRIQTMLKSQLVNSKIQTTSARKGVKSLGQIQLELKRQKEQEIKQRNSEEHNVIEQPHDEQEAIQEEQIVQQDQPLQLEEVDDKKNEQEEQKIINNQEEQNVLLSACQDQSSHEQQKSIENSLAPPSIVPPASQVLDTQFIQQEPISPKSPRSPKNKKKRKQKQKQENADNIPDVISEMVSDQPNSQDQ